LPTLHRPWLNAALFCYPLVKVPENHCIEECSYRMLSESKKRWTPEKSQLVRKEEKYPTKTVTY